MMATNVEKIYEQHIKTLEAHDRLRLLAMVAHDLFTAAAMTSENEAKVIAAKRSLLELEGLGAETWQGIDAQRYTDELRDEWDRRS